MRKKTQIFWTLKEIKILRKLSECGMSAVMIHRACLLSRHTTAAITMRMSELSLGDACIRRRSLNAKRNSRPKRAMILTFLRTEGRKMSSFEAANRLEIDQRMVMYYRRKHRLQLPNHLRFTSQRFVATHAHVLEALNQGLKDHRERFWTDRREQMYGQFTITKDVDQYAIRAYLQCKLCQEKWPLSGKYFYYGRRLPTGERRIQPYCRNCGRGLWGKRLVTVEARN